MPAFEISDAIPPRRCRPDDVSRDLGTSSPPGNDAERVCHVLFNFPRKPRLRDCRVLYRIAGTSETNQTPANLSVGGHLRLTPSGAVR